MRHDVHGEDRQQHGKDDKPYHRAHGQNHHGSKTVVINLVVSLISAS